MAEHSKIVATEFARQAEAFARAPELQAPEVTRRIADALGALRFTYEFALLVAESAGDGRARSAP